MIKYFFIILFLQNVSIYGQNDIVEIERFYHLALEKHVNIKKVKSDYLVSDKIYLLARNVQHALIPKEINGVESINLDVYSRQNKKMLSNGVNLISIEPIKIENNKILIVLTDFLITYKSRNYDFINKGGTITTFEYSCDQNQWVWIETIYSEI